MQRNCKQVLSISENYCIIYTGPSIPQVGLINGECYPLSEIIAKLWEWIQYLAGGGTTTTSTTSTTSSSTTTTTTTINFDSQLSFASSTIDSQEGVQGQSLATNPLLKLEFNKVIDPIGLYNVMTISVQSVQVLQVTYRVEYVGQVFRFTHTNGVQYNGVFGSDINF